MKARKQTLLILLLILGFAPRAFAELPAKMTISGNDLQLNGSGTRSKTLIQIYESGLYLAQPSRDAAAILAADQWMAIRVKITSGFVSRSSLVASLQDSLKKSTGGKTEAIAKETQQFLECLKDEVNKNDIYDFVYVPQKGLYILKNGKAKGTIQGLAFKKALFGIWLSDSPVDKGLRQAMLSGTTRR